MKIAIITNILPKYREGFYDRLFSNKELDVVVYCQKKIKVDGFQTIHDKYFNNVKIVTNVSAKNELISWQFLPWHEIISKYDVVFVPGNPRTLSDLFLGTYLHLVNKKVVLWTMAHSHNSSRFSEYLRLSWSKIFKNIFVYTDKEVLYLKALGFKDNFILGMNNGLDQEKIERVKGSWNSNKLMEWKIINGVEGKLVLLSSSRLESKNKFEIMVDALPSILEINPNVIWCIIGDGANRKFLEDLVNKRKINKNVLFLGAIYEEEKLAPWFLSSKLLIHPGAIGLTLLHAFGYGLPVITHDLISMHGPEFAAYENDETGNTFRLDDSKDLSRTILALLVDEIKMEKMRLNVLAIVKNNYNVDIMVERFIKIAKYTNDNQ
jgi:glycosyltransferase involved in cell wall biosynthesis